jgi:DNA-binding transcriptional ArsR family regulator
MHQFPEHPALLEILRCHQRLWEERQKLWGGSTAASILRVVLMGWLERKPYNLTAIAAASMLSRQAVSRKVEELEADGLVAQVHIRNRIVVIPTPGLLDKVLPRVEGYVAMYEKLAARLLTPCKKTEVPEERLPAGSVFAAGSVFGFSEVAH